MLEETTLTKKVVSFIFVMNDMRKQVMYLELKSSAQCNLRFVSRGYICKILERFGMHNSKPFDN